MRVLFCSHTAQLGGAEVMLEWMIRGLRSRGLSVQVALPDDGPLWARLRLSGVPLREIDFGPLSDATRAMNMGGLGKSGLAVWEVAGRLFEVVRDESIDVLVTNTQKAHIVGALAARRARIPLVWRFHDIVRADTFSLLPRLGLQIAAWSGRPHVLPVSAAAARSLRRFSGIRTIRVVNNGIDRSRLAAKSPCGIRERFGWPRDSVLIGMLGRVVPWKGGREFVRAAKLAMERRPQYNVRFVVVGDPAPECPLFKRDLEGLVSELGLDSVLGFLPFQERVGPVLEDFDVLAQPSIEPDPQPISVIEAMMMGVPVVGFRLGGLPELVQEGRTGRLVQPGDVPALSAALTDVAQDPMYRKRLSSNAEEVARRFTVDAMCDQIERCLQEVHVRSGSLETP